MTYAPFTVTVTNVATQIDVTPEADITSASDPDREEKFGQAIEFDVGANPIYCGPDATVTGTGANYHLGAHDTGPAATRGRLYTAGTHVEVTLQKGEHLWAIAPSGNSVCEGSQVGV